MTPLLSIVTITYNHEPFIAKTIEGVLMQQVNFPIEFIIAEDCSTDGTRAICQRYADEHPELIRLITSESNVGAVANERRAMLAARGKYIAFCEGDDYWTDPLKLQKQVDFLESHPDYSVTFHRCKHYNVETHEMIDDNCGYLFADNNQLGVDITTAQFFKTWITQPLTMVYRVASFDLDVALQYQYYRDMHQIYHLLQAGKGYLFAFDGGVRTMHEGGVASLLSANQWCQTSLPIDREFFKIERSYWAKWNYLQTLQEGVKQFAVDAKIKALRCAVTHFFLSFHLKQFFKNVIYIVNYGKRSV